ncbi:MAG: hypothetical protein KGP28_08820 [Bdellovibrionales bacterium]|nr:hypothetical protein [Bdellovibrionales bacterium]
MSKTKLALLILALTFGANTIAFVFSKKSFTVEEVKNLWIYELPASSSPLDSHVALDLGPHQGILGTLFVPNHLKTAQGVVPLLAGSWQWLGQKNALSIKLAPGLRYQNGDPVLPEHFAGLRDHLKLKSPDLFHDPLWKAWMDAEIRTPDGGIEFGFGSRGPGAGFDLEPFLTSVLTHPLTGAIHPKNLEAIKKGELLTKDWISSGPYKIRKWNPKEITLVSRDDFPIRLPEPFFRTLKYQSAPIKNPSCDFLLGRAEEQAALREHSQQETGLELTVFWVCRSFREAGACSDPRIRAEIAKALSSDSASPNQEPPLRGLKVRYRIPVGSDSFREEFRGRIRNNLAHAGALVEETSYFFKSSRETDLELQFVVTPSDSKDRDFAMSLARISSRLGIDSLSEPHLIGEVTRFPLSVFMKKMKGNIFGKVFLEPDLDEKRMPL